MRGISNWRHSHWNWLQQRRRADFPEEIMSDSTLATIDTDKYDRWAFQRLNRSCTDIRDAARGVDSGVWPPFIRDIWSALFKLDPKFNEDAAPSVAMNKAYIESLMTNPKYQELRKQTKLNEFSSALGTVNLANMIMKQLPPGAGQAGDESQKNQKRADDENEKAQQCQSEADGDQENKDGQGDNQEGESQEGDGQGESQQQQSGGGGKKKHKPQKKQKPLSDKQRQKMQDEAQKHRDKAKEFEGKANEWSKMLDEHIKDNQEKIDKGMDRALDNIKKEIDEAEELMRAFGHEPGHWERTPVEKKLALAQMLMSRGGLKALAKMAGRMQRMALAMQSEKTRHGNQEKVDVEQGHNIRRCLPSEFARLKDKYLRYDFYKRYAEHRLLQYRTEGFEHDGKGPIIVCIDSSGSMKGGREQWSKAFALALCTVAARQKRTFAVIHFAASKSTMQSYLFPRGHGNLIEGVAEPFNGGGTSFEAPLSEAIKIIEGKAEGVTAGQFRMADIVFITDGECSTQTDFITDFNRRRKRHGTKVYSMQLCTQLHDHRADNQHHYGTKSFSDKVYTPGDPGSQYEHANMKQSKADEVIKEIFRAI